ncbi:glycosyltransferase family 1 protein [Ferruginibacter paludis]|uniref:glycosyltransferase family 4 protein n=1 Tax=Ferruginibacter paludis TaxID=1310417 RepID=UPI0025B47FF2|nr:glycosyltransferase family 1 protein [Ferruginibacter paludis]MDN3655870.1 glycosyltransferase family 1 protein [Ferruginibacter paludis]
MDKRIRLGLIFSVDENWIGGTYYILNLISALSTLPVEKQPFITILSKRKTDLTAAQKTGYPYLDYQNPFDYKRNLAEAAINKLAKFFTGRDIIDKRISEKRIDVLFPASNDTCFDRIANKVFWFPDFQHIVYPDFFKASELAARNHVIKEIADSNKKLVLSSEAAKSDWESLELTGHCEVHVIPFAVTHPAIADLKINDLLKELEIDKDYFIISNQFWKHKNHQVVLNAAVELLKRGVKFQFVFTGKEDDYRNPGYFSSILHFIDQHRLNDNIKMLGLIDRRKQLKLMQHSIAVIQPSLFEGWSTVIEDAKSLGKFVIASDIAVHREQLPWGGCFFAPHDSDFLAELICTTLLKQLPVLKLEYVDSIKKFGHSFINVLK